MTLGHGVETSGIHSIVLMTSLKSKLHFDMENLIVNSKDMAKFAKKEILVVNVCISH